MITSSAAGERSGRSGWSGPGSSPSHPGKPNTPGTKKTRRHKAEKRAPTLVHNNGDKMMCVTALTSERLGVGLGLGLGLRVTDYQSESLHEFTGQI